jgi:glycosyltransferase involved in cell wall biosynthesis
MQPEFSFVIPVLNGAATIEATLTSILQQSHRDFEVIVVDNNSTDATPEICRSFPTIAYLFEAKPGPSAARNAGARHAQGRYVAFVDCDVVLDQDWLAAVWSNLQETPVDMLATQVIPLQEQKANIVDEFRLSFGDFKSHGTFLSVRKHLAHAPVVNTSACVCNRASLLRVGLFDEHLQHNEDFELSMRMFYSGHLLAGTQAARSYVRFFAASRTLRYLRRLYLKRSHTIFPRPPFSQVFLQQLSRELERKRLALASFTFFTELISAVAFLLSLNSQERRQEREDIKARWRSVKSQKHFNFMFFHEDRAYKLANHLFLLLIDQVFYVVAESSTAGVPVSAPGGEVLKKMLRKSQLTAHESGQLVSSGLFTPFSARP